MYTEEEAKTKWCPQMIDHRGEFAGNDCIASRCMAWRWLPRESRMVNDDVVYVQVGYCGLAGKP